jgi:hypothetical protein
MIIGKFDREATQDRLLQIIYASSHILCSFILDLISLDNMCNLQSSLKQNATLEFAWLCFGILLRALKRTGVTLSASFWYNGDQKPAMGALRDLFEGMGWI